tara:strand:- start:1111 stop:2802 length:1692 start_codon:yes stop_codon:yes gene_type:complete
MIFSEKCSQYKSITLNKRQLCDFELIVNGAFSPLNGFMNKKDYESCVFKMRLNNNNLWAMPITLSINEKQRDELKHSNYVVLKHETGLPLGLMNISDSESIYKYNLEQECKNVYGSFDDNHPYIDILKKSYDSGKIFYIGGKIEEFELPPHYDFIENRMTPKETKEYFKKNGWSKIVGFQTRNPMHRSHYELTKYALKVAGSDSRLFLNPVVGITQECDINYHTRVKCYKKLMQYYDEESAILSLLPLTMRMAGPREAVWHAQIRKNYGCTHFVVGRDHAGPSYKKKDGTEFYGPYDAQDLLMKHADEIGIIPIVSKMIVYALPNDEHNEMNGKYMPIDEVDENKYKVMNISGTQQRELLKKGKKIPEWFTFSSVEKELKKSYKPLNEQGFTLYFVGLSGSGKSTLANFVMAKLNEYTNRKITYLDGDIVRLNLSQGLGFSEQDRSINVRRIGFCCNEVTKHGGIAVAANIAPFEEDRKYNREQISTNGHYIEIFVNTSLENCEKRDVKGLYKLARKGIIKEFTGITSRFDVPKNSEIIINDKNKIESNVDIIIDYLRNKDLI